MTLNQVLGLLCLVIWLHLFLIAESLGFVGVYVKYFLSAIRFSDSFPGIWIAMFGLF